MITLRFIKRPGPAFLRQIIALYSRQGWWDKSGKDALAGLIRNSHCFIVALDKGRVVGMGRAISDRVSDAYIQDVAVLKEYRGQGLGSRLPAQDRSNGSCWGHSSVGRARALQARGHRFEPGCLHQSEI